MKIYRIVVCFIFGFLPAWFQASAQSNVASKPRLLLMDTTTVRLRMHELNLPVWLTVSGDTARGVKVEIPRIVSDDGKIIPLKKPIESEIHDILPGGFGHIFNLELDSSQVAISEAVAYKATLFVSAQNTESLLGQYNFEVLPPQDLRSSVQNFLQALQGWLDLIWQFFELLLLLFLFVVIVLLLVFAFRKRHTLKVIPIVNETGVTGKLEGVASGIDDILMVKLQEIRKLSTSEQAILSQPIPSNPNIESKNVLISQAQSLRPAGGGFLPELQKIGDIAIGPIKIPLRAIVGFVLKITGGTFISGALQTYGKTNKIVLYLENQPNLAISFVKKFFKNSERINPKQYVVENQYFEVTWHTDPEKNVDHSDLMAEEVPRAIEELAYKIALAMETEVGTDNWLAYKNFLDGNATYQEYQLNTTRKDCLRDAIDYWRESVRLDPNFAKAHYNLGVALEKEQNYEDAIFRYQKAIRLSPDLVAANAHYNLAYLYWLLIKENKSLDDSVILDELRKARTINPRIPDIYNLEGLVHSARKEFSQEVAFYEKAIELSGQNPDPIFYYNLCMVTYDLYLDDHDIVHLEAARKAGERALELYWQNLWKFYGRRAAQMSGKKYDLDKLTKVLRGNSNVQNLIKTMASIYLENASKAEGAAQSNAYRCAVPFLKERFKMDPRNNVNLSDYGLALRENGQLQEALLMQRRLIRLWPELPEGYSELARTLRMLNLAVDEADIFKEVGKLLSQIKGSLTRESLEAAFNNEKASPKAQKIYLVVLASVYHYFFRDKKKAIAYFRKALGSPETYLLDAELHYTFALVLWDQKKYAEVITQLTEAATHFEDAQAYDTAECYADLAKWHTEIADNDYENYKAINKPDLEQAEKAFQNAYSAYQNAYEANKKASAAYTRADLTKLAYDNRVAAAKFLMDWYWKGGHEKSYTWAREECNKAIQLDNNNYEAFHVKGNTFYDLRRYAEAIPQYEKALELNFDLEGAHYNLGLCYNNLGNYERAIEQFETTIKLNKYYADDQNKNLPDPYQWLAHCLEKTNALEEAVRVLREVVSLFPNSAKYKIMLAEYLEKSYLYDEASKTYRNVLQTDPDNIQALNRLANLYSDQGADLEEALSMSLQALKLNKAEQKIAAVARDKEKKQMMCSEIRKTLGWICYQKRQTKRAILFLEKSLKFSLEDTESHAHLAYAYEKYAATVQDPADKKFYAEKAEMQWRTVLKTDSHNFWSDLAAENIKRLKWQT